ncbi:MAG: replicative DNA helicase [Oscillospiraceae bacterium]|nr:replicative DNA helicase [Oscillospiraceae bacterium]
MAEFTSKTVPFSLEAEQSVLGSILVDPERFTEVTGIIKSDDFYLEEHRQIYDAMRELFLVNRQIDPVTLIDKLVELGVYDRERSMAYIKLIVDVVPSAANVADYARIVKSKSLLRQLLTATDEINAEVMAEAGDARTIIEAAEGRIMRLGAGNISGDLTHIREVLLDAYAQLDEISKNNGKKIGVQSGFSALDNVLIGMASGDFVLVGARPGMGKTSFAVNLATNIAHTSGKAACIFSMEMTKTQLATRMLSSEALVDSRELRSGNISESDWKKLAGAASYLSACEIYIDDSAGITVASMKAKLKRQKNLGFVVVDYLQLMQSDRRTENRTQEVAEISRGLKLMAKDLGVPVLACAQLSRASETRGDKRPMLSDLRESGSIEQDADMVLFLYRDEYYNKDDPDNVNKAEVIVAKNRHGSTGNVEIGFFGKYTKFSTLDTREEGY